MKKSPVFSMILLCLCLSGYGQYKKVVTIDAPCQYLTDVGATTYLVAVHKGHDSIKAYQPQFLNSPIYAFKPYIPSGFELDSVYMLGFEVLNNLDFGFAYTVKNKFGDSKGIICNSDGDLKWQQDDIVAFKTMQTTGFFKIAYIKASSGKMSTHVMDMAQKEEAIYPTGDLGGGILKAPGSTANYRFYYVNVDSSQLMVHAHDHQLLDKISISKPSGFNLLPQSTLFPQGDVTPTDINFGVYFEKMGSPNEYTASIINRDRVVQTFANSLELDLQERNNGSIVNSRIKTNGEDIWQVYTLSPSSGNTNTATYSFNLRSKLIYENRYSQSAFGIPTNDFVVDFYDVFLNKKQDLQVPLDLKTDDVIVSWRAFHDGSSNGLTKDQEVYYLSKNGKSGAYSFKVSNSEKQNLLERKDAESFYMHPDEVDDRTQFVLNISGTGAEVYEYDFSVSDFRRISPKNGAKELDHKSVRFTWESADHAENYSLTIMEDTVTFKGYRSYGQLTDTFYTLENLLDSGVSYYWKVSGTNRRAISSQRSYYKFTTLDPSALTTPTLISPSNDKQNVSYGFLTLVWSNVTNAESYTYQLSSSSTFDNYIAGDPTDTFIEVKNLSKNTKYYWRVRAQKKGSTGDWSTVSSFTTALVDDVDEQEKIGLLLYPNPANGIVVISTKLWQDAQFEVYNNQGQQVYSGTLTAKGSEMLNVSTWSSGVYEIHLLNRERRIRRKLIVN